MKETLSGFIDGEFQRGELQMHLARIKSDAELRNAWNTYHLIGDALRGPVCPDFTSRVVTRLRDEPALLAPKRGTVPSRRLGWYVVSAAAGAAAVALVVWTAAPIWQAEPKVAANPTGVDLASSGRGPVTAVSLPMAEVKPPVSAAAVENYLYAHQPYSHTSAVQGIALYARSIADEPGGDGK